MPRAPQHLREENMPISVRVERGAQLFGVDPSYREGDVDAPPETLAGDVFRSPAGDVWVAVSPKHLRIADRASARGGEDVMLPVSSVAYQMMKKVMLDAAQMAINPRIVVDPAKLDLDADLRPKLLIDKHGRRVCGCDACVRRRYEQAQQLAYDMDKVRAARGRDDASGLCRCTRDAICKACADRQWSPKPPRVRVNKCDCPGCQPEVSARRQAASGGPGFLVSPMGQALRFAGLNTPDPKRLGAGQYVRRDA